MSQETKIEQTENNLFQQTKRLFDVLATFEQKAAKLNDECAQNIRRLGIDQFEGSETRRIEEEETSYRLYIEQVDETFTQNVEKWRKAKFDALKKERDQLAANVMQACQEAEKYEKNTLEEEYSDKRLKKEARQAAASAINLLPMHIIVNIIGLCLLAWMVYGSVTTSLASEPLLNFLKNPITWGGLGGMALLAIVMYIWGYKSEYAERVEIREREMANHDAYADKARTTLAETRKALSGWDAEHPDLATVADIKMPRAVAEQLLQDTINSIDPAHKHWEYRFQINYNGQDCI